jgi:pimeloyl-ACP methyl ester carboxylesterase
LADHHQFLLLAQTKAIHNAVLAEMQQGHDVNFFCHPYGGVPTSQALRGLEKPQSVGGGRVSGIVYIAAFLLAEFVSQSAGLAIHGGSANDPFYELLEDRNTLIKRTPMQRNDFTMTCRLRKESAGFADFKLTHHQPFACPTDYVAWKDIPSWYLICKQDQVMAPEVQRVLVKEGREYLDQVGGPGTGELMLRNVGFDAGHSPFLGRPEETAAFIESAAVAYRN